jgi:hypothetical protein
MVPVGALRLPPGAAAVGYRVRRALIEQLNRSHNLLEMMRDQEVRSRLVELISQIEAKRRNSRRPVSRMNSDESRAPSDCRVQPVSSAQRIFCHLFGRRDARRTTASPCPRRDVVQTNITEIGVGMLERHHQSSLRAAVGKQTAGPNGPEYFGTRLAAEGLLGLIYSKVRKTTRLSVDCRASFAFP